jgi:predicted nuclease of predicted toxin-antitoxin system
MGSLAEQLRPIATGLAASPRVYADANLPAGVVAFMRSELGWDVLFVLEDDGLRRAPDEEHFRLALEFGRTLITLDYDFWDERRFPMASSPGVIVCSAPDEAGLMRLLRHADRSLLRPATPAALPLRGRKIELTPGVFSGNAPPPGD